jgi:hypothetical protein
MRRAVIGLLICLCLACSEPPLKERQQADEALATARTAGAAIYAADELKAAEAALKTYDEAVAQHDYRQALNRALDARDRAYEAARLAGEQKKALQKQIATLTTDTKALIHTAESRIAASRTSRAADKLRPALHNASQALQESIALSGKGDYRGAVKRLTEASESLRKELVPSDPPNKRGRK